MRNLKRVLSLTLASIMLLGMMVVGASAADYSDVDYDKDNVEAIEVLNAVGVMLGDADSSGNLTGEFRPGDPVSRAEMAVIMAKLMDLDYNYYIGVNPFNDMVGHWAEGYVAACYANRIIAGRSATTYDPSATVTTVEAAAMLMRALGYFQYASDTADGFEISTIRQGGRIELFNGVNTKTTEALTRNDVAQLVLNTLKSGMVETNDNNKVSVNVGDAQVTVGGSSYQFVIDEGTNIDYATSIKDEYGYSIYGSNGYIVELGEKLYQGDLKMFDDEIDAFGRPAVRWTYKTEEIGTYIHYPTVYKSWTAKVAKNELYSFLGSTNSSNLKLVDPDKFDPDGKNQLCVYVDGQPLVPGTTGETLTKESFVHRDNTGAVGGHAGAGKGVLTEVFQDNDNNVTITFTGTYVMQATADYNTSSDSVRVTVLTSPYRLDRAKDKTGTSATVSENVLKAEDFPGLADLGIKEDDYILYTCSLRGGVNSPSIESVQKANVISGEITAFSIGLDGTDKRAEHDANGSVTVDGAKHDYAKHAETDDANGCAVEYKVGAEASIVLDAYDYAIYVDDSSLSVGNYVYVYAVAPESNLANTFVADAFFTDGTRGTITVKEMRTTASGSANLANKKDIDERLGADEAFKVTTDSKGDPILVGGWYDYSKNSSNQYTLVKADSTNPFPGTTVKIENGKVRIGNVSTLAGNSNTIFVVYQGNNKVSVYTGIANAPDVTGADATTSWYLHSKDNPDRFVSAVFIDASIAGATVRNGNSDLLYVLKEDTHERSKDNVTGDTVYTFNVILVKDGKAEAGKVQTTQNWNKNGAGHLNYVYNAFTSYGIDTDGYYELDASDAIDSNPGEDDVFDHITGAKEIKCDGYTFTWGDKKYVINSNSEKGTALVAYPNKDADGSDSAAANALKKEVNLDADATYKTYEQISGKQIANQFRGWYAVGDIFAIKDKDVVKSMVVVIYGIFEEEGTIESEPVDVTLKLKSDEPITVDSTGKAVYDILENGETVKHGAKANDVIGTLTITIKGNRIVDYVIELIDKNAKLGDVIKSLTIEYDATVIYTVAYEESAAAGGTYAEDKAEAEDDLAGTEVKNKPEGPSGNDPSGDGNLEINALKGAFVTNVKGDKLVTRVSAGDTVKVWPALFVELVEANNKIKLVDPDEGIYEILEGATKVTLVEKDGCKFVEGTLFGDMWGNSKTGDSDWAPEFTGSAN